MEKLMVAKILITGANGFVGSYVCRRFHESGEHPIRAVVRTQAAVVPLASRGIETVVLSDTTNASAWAAIMDGVTTVIHLAARAHVLHDTDPDPMATCRKTNVHMTEALAQAALASNVQRFIYASTVKVHGVDARETQLDPSEALHPQDPYGVTKLEGENCVKAMVKGSNMQCAIVRLPLVFGPGVRANMLRLMQWVNSGVPLPFGAINNQRSMLSLDNLTSFFETCVTHPDPSGIWMVSEATHLSTPQLVQMLGDALGKKPRLISVPLPLLKLLGTLTGKNAEITRLLGSLFVNTDETHEKLGWYPTVTTEESFRKMAHWFLEREA